MRSSWSRERADWTAIVAILLGGLVGLIAFALMMPWQDLDVSVEIRVDTELIERILP